MHSSYLSKHSSASALFLARFLFRRLPTHKAGLVSAFFVLISTIQAVTSPAYAAPAQLSDIGKVIQNVIGLLAPAAAIAFLLVFIVGAYKYMTSGGDPKATASARATLTYAIIGVILVVVSYLVLKLIEDITKVPITTVTFPTAP